MNKKCFTLISILIVVTLVAALYFISRTKPYNNESATSTAETTATKWQTYTNEKHGYTIEYPEGWYFHSISTDSDFIQQGPNKYNIFAGQWYVTPQNPAKYNISNAPENPFEISYTIYQADTNTTLDKFLKNLQIDVTKATQEALKVNDLSGYKLNTLSVDSNTGMTGEYNDIYLKHDDKVFVISYHGYPITNENRAVAEHIINSFTVKK